MIASNRSKPNVIVFFTDQQRWDTSGLHGNPMGLTPNFDRMAQRGTHFTNAFTCQPVCGPARSCLQTGLYATQTGVFRNHQALKEDALTLAKLFKEGGYQTAYIGKWHLGGSKPSFTEPGIVPKEKRGGYDHWLGVDLPEFISDAYRTILFDETNQQVKLPGYRVDAYTDAAIRYIDQHRDVPFFLFLSFLEPHMQNTRDDYPAPDGYKEKYRGGWIPPDLAALGGSTHRHLAGYYGIIKRLDEALGRLLDALKSLKLLDDTIVLSTSDHGCHFRTRNEEYKRSCHESSIRIPAAMQGPCLNGGGQINELVSILDFPPTLLEAAGLPVPKQMMGHSVIHLLYGRRDGWGDDVFIQISESQVGRAVRTHRWKYSVSAPDKNGFQDSYSDKYKEEFLYDLRADPYELNNLIGLKTHQEVTRMMQKRLTDRILEVEGKRVTIESQPLRTEKPPKYVYSDELSE